MSHRESPGESSTASVIQGPHQPRTYNFPSRPFGKTKVVHRSFQGKWFDKYTWLHYDDRGVSNEIKSSTKFEIQV